MGPGWRFGHSSTGESGGRFWQMDLGGKAAFEAIWEQARAQCEALAGKRLRVIRQYANGHTYGLGGAAHTDDDRPDTYTLLWYPNPEWRPDWEGETVWYDQSGDIGFIVQPRPNRAVFFDSRIPHNGRAPARGCPALRVTVAWKLEANPDAHQPVASPSPARSPLAAGREIVRRVDKAALAQAAEQRLAQLAGVLRLPGSAAAQEAALRARYADRAREDAAKEVARAMIESELLPGGMIPMGYTLHPDEHGLEVRFQTTVLAELAPVDPSSWSLERLIVGPADQAAAMLKLRTELVDRIADAFPFPILPSLVDGELADLAAAAQARGLSPTDLGAPTWGEALLVVAERRLRVRFAVAELARRLGLPQSADMAATEQRVIDHILSTARIDERPATDDELTALRS
jgi:SM-20-related protein